MKSIYFHRQFNEFLIKINYCQLRFAKFVRQDVVRTSVLDQDRKLWAVDNASAGSAAHEYDFVKLNDTTYAN